MLVLVFFLLIFLLPLWHTRVSPSDSAWPSSSSLALSPFFFLLCSFFRSRTALVLVLSVRTPRTLGFVSTLYLCSPLSFSFHLSSYILFPYRPSGLPWLLPPTVMVRESESLFAKRLSVGVKTMVFFFHVKHWHPFHIEVLLMCCMRQSVQGLTSKVFYVDVILRTVPDYKWASYLVQGQTTIPYLSPAGELRGVWWVRGSFVQSVSEWVTTLKWSHIVLSDEGGPLRSKTTKKDAVKASTINWIID